MKEDLIKWLDKQIRLSKEEIHNAHEEENIERVRSMSQWLAALVHVKVNYAELLPNEPNVQVSDTTAAD